MLPSNFKTSVVRVVTGAIVSLLCGCGQSGPKADIEKTVEARGTLTFQGKALEFYQVMVYPEGHRPAAGTTDQSGNFILGTNGKDDGAVAGKHPVAIVYVGPPPGPEAGMNDFSPPPPPKEKVPAKYTKAETSGVTLDIPSGGSQELKIDLQ